MAFRYIGTSTTTITNEGTENPTINGMVVTTKTEGDIVFYQTGRYVWLDDMWNYQGDLHTHADVQSALNEIAEAYKGEEVRGSIYDAIALIDTRSAAMEDTIGANITSMVEPIVDRKISTFILDYETSVGNVAQCNLTYEQLRTKLTSNLKAIVHVNGYECDCRIDVQSTYIDVYATSDPMKNNEDTRGTIYYKFNHNNDSVTVNYEQSSIKYQEKLTAGPNIIIDGNEISAVGGVNTIGIEFMIDTNTTYIHDIDEITINKTWSEVEMYMDAVYESGNWDDYDLWHEIQKDCVLKDLRDDPDYSVYPLVGVKFKSFNSGGYPVLLFSSRALSDDGMPENNVHYISFKWPNLSWSDSHLESNIDEFDILSGDTPLFVCTYPNTVTCNLPFTKIEEIYAGTGDTKASMPQLIYKYSSSSDNGTRSVYCDITQLDEDTFIFTFNMGYGKGISQTQWQERIIEIQFERGDSLSKIADYTLEYQKPVIAGDGIELENVGTGTNQKTQISVADALTMIGESSGSVTSFDDGGDNMPLKSCIVSIEPVQSGSGDPSPSNVRPISGWNECNVNVYGKSEIDTSTIEIGKYLSTDGSTGNSSSSNVTDYIEIKSNTAYVFAFDFTSLIASGVRNICFYNSNKTFISYVAYTSDVNTKKVIINTPNNAKYVRITTDKNYTDMSLNEDTIYNIQFPSQAGIVYGGTLDVTNGVLIVDRAMVNLGSLSWRVGYDGFYASLGSLVKANTNLFCEIYKQVTYYNNRPDYSLYWENNNKFLLVKDSRYTDTTAYTTAMDGVKLVYELATPQTYNLTPTEVKTLLGINNIFADCGDIDVKYVRDATTVINGIGGDSYTNGDGIDITNDEISVKLRSSNPGLAFDSNGGLYATGGGGGGTTYTAGTGIDIDANNKISTFTIKVGHQFISGTPIINHTWAEISSAVETYGSVPCYLFYSHGTIMIDSVEGAYTASNTAIIIRFKCIYDNTIDLRKYVLEPDGTFTLDERTVTDYQKKLTAGTGISIDPTTNTISLDLPQAEGGGF